MEKEKILKLIEKMKNARNLTEEVNKEIPTCITNDRWQIYEIDSFKAVCKVLQIDYEAKKDKKSGYTHYNAVYDGLRIVACGEVDDE